MRERKRIVFYLITFATPVVFFILLELVLRLLGYGSTAPVAFIADTTDANFMIMNPAVGERYFPNKDFATVGAYDLFLKDKPENGFRVFVQGASSSAGFPYNHSGSFPRLLEQKLQYSYPQKNIEVVNTSLTATNSYALLDLADEIIEQSPNLVVIYAGHNEYYGALGVASSQSFGRSPMVTNFYLKLKNVRVVQLIRSIVKGFYGAAQEPDDKQTLMAKMIKEESIPYDSEIHHSGINQYKTNLGLLLDKYNEAGVPVFVCTLVSNLKDFAPFQSSTDQYSASETYLAAKKEISSDSLMAKELFIKAKDYDLLKFRAPSEIEGVIRSLATEKNARLIDVKAAFEAKSSGAIVGNELLLEHVHPNLNGQRLLAGEVFLALSGFLEEQGITGRSLDGFEYNISEVDSLYGHTLLQQLLNNWPFTNESNPPAPATNDIERLITGELPWVAVMNSNYVSNIQVNPVKALKTAKALLQEYPHQTQPYIMVAESYNKLGRYKEAEDFLSTMPEKLKSLSARKVRLTNLVDMKEFGKGVSVARTILQLEKSVPNQYNLQALSDILAIDLNNLSDERIRSNPEAFIKALGALYYLKLMDDAGLLYAKLKATIPDNEQLLQLKSAMQLQ